MIRSEDARKLMLYTNRKSEKEKLIVEAAIYKAILGLRTQCMINFRISMDTTNWVRSYGYNVIFTTNFTIISW